MAIVGDVTAGNVDRSQRTEAGFGRIVGFEMLLATTADPACGGGTLAIYAQRCDLPETQSVPGAVLLRGCGV